MELKGKRILVTGADGGIGSTLSHALAETGARLVLCSYSAGKLSALADDLCTKQPGLVVDTIQADIASREDRERVAETCAQLGGIDVLVNLAGVLDFNLYQDQSPEIIERTLGINLMAPMLLCQALLPQLQARPEATILNVGSIFGSIGHPGFVAYCASKAGMKTFSEALGRELADTSVRVSYIAPRATATALNTDRVNAMNSQLGNKMDTPEYVADKIIHQLRNDSLLTYLGWPENLFVRINALLPSVVRKALVKNLGIIKQYASS